MNTVQLRGVRRLADTPFFCERVRFKSSASGQTYTISRHRKTRKLMCSCKAWIFTKQDCKHIKALRKG